MQPLFTTVFADGQVQSIRPMAGDMGGRWVAVSSQAHNWNIDPIHDVNKFKDSLWRNPLYSLWEGMNESPWTFITPYIVVPNAGNTILEAPTTPLNTTVRVDPLAVTAPGSSVPSAADPTTVTAPPAPSITQNQQSTSSNTVFSSTTSLTAGTNVSSPSFGVQSLLPSLARDQFFLLVTVL
jgi:hypothetical protein